METPDYIKAKRLALLEETAAFYNLGNRAYIDATPDQGTTCRYYLEGTEGCAIGRKIADKELCKKLDKLGSVNRVFELLPIDLQKLGKDFLISLQGLHDFRGCWNATGLSEYGLKKVELIKTTYCL